MIRKMMNKTPGLVLPLGLEPLFSCSRGSFLAKSEFLFSQRNPLVDDSRIPNGISKYHKTTQLPSLFSTQTYMKDRSLAPTGRGCTGIISERLHWGPSRSCLGAWVFRRLFEMTSKELWCTCGLVSKFWHHYNEITIFSWKQIATFVFYLKKSRQLYLQKPVL